MGQSDSRPRTYLNNTEEEIQLKLALALSKAEADESLRRAEINRRADINRRLEFNRQAEINRRAEINRQAEIKRQELINRRADINRRIRTINEQQLAVSSLPSSHNAQPSAVVSGSREQVPAVIRHDLGSNVTVVGNIKYNNVVSPQNHPSVSGLSSDTNLHVSNATTSNENATSAGNKNQGTNLYIKNLDQTIDNGRLRREFSRFGRIVSVKVIMEGNQTKGFGFVCFSSPVDANTAIMAMNGRVVGSKSLHVALARKQSRPVVDSQPGHLAKNNHQGMKLYVKNLDYTIDDERLRREFSPFGKILSANVIKVGNKSKGFGFVWFSSPDDASRAITGMNGRTVGSQALYVALAGNGKNQKNSSARNTASDEPDEKLSCKICFDKDFSHILECNHVLCESCADTVFNNHHLCPFCRKYITIRPKPIHF